MHLVETKKSEKEKRPIAIPIWGAYLLAAGLAVGGVAYKSAR